MAPSIEIMLNGDKREVPDGLTVAALLSHLGLRPDRVAVERNLHVLPRSAWGTTPVRPGDRFEIVQLVGGG